MYPYFVSLPKKQFDEILNQVERLQEPRAVSELSGGLTNRNLKVVNQSGSFVARISSNESALLSIDRTAEFENSKIAAEAGIGAQVFEYLPDQGLLVIGYIEGNTLDAMGVANNLSRIAASCRVLHSAKKFVSDFNMFNIQKGYLDLVIARGFKLPDGYLNYSNHLADMASALSVLNEGQVPCNNDLLPANFIDDGKKIWLIDYEYSGNNDACFELGNIWSEAKLPYDALAELVTSYYGRFRPEKLARAWLYAVLAKYGWTLWASIQNSISELDFDFWGWGMEKYEDAQRSFTGSDFQLALTQVATKS